MSISIIGFIGYGAMASLMGQNLEQAGYEVIAYTPSGKGHGDADVPMLASPRLVAEQSDAVILCVPDDAAENECSGTKLTALLDKIAGTKNRG